MHDPALANDIALVKQSRIYFGHHSVGNNILNGVFDLASAAAPDGGFEIRPLSETPGDAESYFAESYVGENTRPETKCSAFARSLANFNSHPPRIAFMKFCFIDFGQGMSAEEIFSLYASTIDSLKRQYPAVTFIHVTAPLTARHMSVKAFIKKLIGRSDNFEADNAERGRFNRLMRERFSAEPVFDLARIESTRPDGSRETFMLAGEAVEAMAPAYTDDGGHLNEAGQKRAARELIRLLAGVIRAQKESVQASLPKK